MPRHNLFTIVFFFGLANAMIRPVKEHINEFGWLDSAISGFGVSFIVWFAIYCAFDMLYKKQPRNSASATDWCMAAMALTLCILPSAMISWLALASFSIYCAFYVYARATPERNGALILLAVALRVPISDLFLKLSSDALLQFDAMATLTMLRLIDPAAIRIGNIVVGSSGHELLIMTGCASFTNVSLALLLWFTILRTQLLHWSRTITLSLIPLVVAVVAVNIGRLTMMARSQEAYFFYHDGLGADIINAAILLIALAIAALCVVFEKRRAAHVA